jgi:hypothetical protein
MFVDSSRAGADLALEAGHVDPVGICSQLVAAGAGLDGASRHRSVQRRNVDLQSLGGRTGWIFPPQRVDQLCGRHHPAGAEGQHLENGSLLRRRRHGQEGSVLAEERERPEQAYQHYPKCYKRARTRIGLPDKHPSLPALPSPYRALTAGPDDRVSPGVVVWLRWRRREDSMLRFCGSDLKLVVEGMLPAEARGGWPVVYSAREGDGTHWLIVQVDDNPLHLDWLCAPITDRALQAVVEGRGTPADALRHSSTGTAELVTIERGRAVSDRCLLGAQVAETLSAAPCGPAGLAA